MVYDQVIWPGCVYEMSCSSFEWYCDRVVPLLREFMHSRETSTDWVLLLLLLQLLACRAHIWTRCLHARSLYAHRLLTALSYLCVPGEAVRVSCIQHVVVSTVSLDIYQHFWRHSGTLIICCAVNEFSNQFVVTQVHNNLYTTFDY